MSTWLEKHLVNFPFSGSVYFYLSEVLLLSMKARTVHLSVWDVLPKCCLSLLHWLPLQ